MIVPKTFTTAQIESIITKYVRQILRDAEGTEELELVESHCYHLQLLMKRFE